MLYELISFREVTSNKENDQKIIHIIQVKKLSIFLNLPNNIEFDIDFEGEVLGHLLLL